MPEDCFLRSLAELSTEDVVLDPVRFEKFGTVVAYLNDKTLPSVDDLDLFNYLCITSLDLSSVLEKDMRKNMYVTDDNKYKDPYYGLVKLTSELWESIHHPEVEGDEFVYNKTKLVKNDWDIVQKHLLELKEVINENTLVAGGAVFSSLFENKGKKGDIDIFIHGLDEQQAKQEILKIRDKGFYYCCRTANTLTFSNRYQVVLRLYQTPSEIIHGFDVDCCCMTGKISG